MWAECGCEWLLVGGVSGRGWKWTLLEVGRLEVGVVMSRRGLWVGVATVSENVSNWSGE